MTYHVRPLARAQLDVDCILDFIRNKKGAPHGASLWLEAYQEAVVNLAKNPLAYGFAPENRHVGYDLRQVLFRTRHGRTYRILFAVVDNEIRILRVRGPGQRPLRRTEIGE